MTATHYRLGQSPAAGAAEDEFAGARRRLTLAVLWLAGLVAWGLFSYVTDLATGDQGRDAVRAEQAFDGHGKWSGY